MSMHRRLTALGTVLATVFGFVAVLAPCAIAITVDNFSNNFPVNVDVPREIIFVGSMCNAATCPPGVIVTHAVSDFASQTGLSGVLGGARYALITRTGGTASAAIYDSYNLLEISHNTASNSIVTLTYGMSSNLNSNFTALGSTELQINLIEGELSATRPVPCTITVTSGRGTANEHTANVTKTLAIASGIVAFPFSEFTSVDFTDVDGITYKFDASQYAARAVDFAIGPLMTDEHPVGTEPTTWGAIKSLFK
jgi:hypothetical protein